MTPKPEQAPRVLIGAQSQIGIDRAARMADGVITLSNDHFRWYLDAVQKYGGNVDEARIYASQWVIVAEDPEKVWAEGVGERALFQINEYIAWGSFEGPDQPAQFDSPQALLDAGIYRLMDAAAAVEDLVGIAAGLPAGPRLPLLGTAARRDRGVRVRARPVPGRQGHPRGDPTAGEGTAAQPA